MASQSATIAQTIASFTQSIRGPGKPTQTIASFTQSATGKKANEAGTAAQTIASFTQAAAANTLIGPGSEDNQNAQYELIPVASVDVVLTSDFNLANFFKCGYARRLWVGTGGNVVAQKRGDDAPHTYKNVASGSYLDGWWILVKSTSNGTTAADIVAER